MKNGRKERILYLVWKYKEVSRRDLAREMDLNLPTISNLVGELKKKGLITETGYSDSTGGRKAQLLTLSSREEGIIGIYVSSSRITSVISDMSGIWSHRTALEIKKPYEVENILSVLDQSVNLQLNNASEKGIKIVKIGVAISGIVDSKKGISVKFPRCEGWKKIELKKILEDEFGIPTVVENNIRAVGLAENIWGKYRDYKNILYINLGYGIGMGIIINGTLYRGSNLNAGELGHITIVENGPLCYCGNTGCLESVASIYAMVAKTKKALKAGVNTKITKYASENGEFDGKAIFKAASEGDRFAYNLIEDSGHYIGTVIANLFNLFGSEVIVLGGQMANYGEQILEPISRTVRQRTLEHIERKAEIVFSSFGKDEGCTGAVVLTLDDYYRHLVLDEK